ncbi:MAG: AraC family transcriptional regulator [Flavobacteriaceae bacterium]|nr:AraC family transcriptional regulator [Flavobacteriaceae bacterium]
MEKFIERATRYPLEHGMLSVYESNTPSKDIKFYFEKNVITIMSKGHKSVVANGERYEFFPGSFLIPERKIVQSVSIPSASFDNPTQCLELELDPCFIQRYYEEIQQSKESRLLLKQPDGSSQDRFFLSNNTALIDIVFRIYARRLLEDTKANQMIITLMLKEMLLIVFQTNGLFLLLENIEDTIKDPAIQKCVQYVSNNIDGKITVDEMVVIAGMGNTTFFKKFKEATGASPVEYILKRRINHAKMLIKKNELSLKEVAFNSGFNSYEYFCSMFRKVEGQKPSQFRKAMLVLH